MLIRVFSVSIVFNLFLVGYLLSQKVEKAVLFGEHASKLSTVEENKYRIFMDMNGDFYPENKISDSELRGEGNSQLKSWARSFPEKFRIIAKDYNLTQTHYSEVNFRVLQDSIISTITNHINNHPRGTNQTWLIHGYRKELYDPEGKYDSTSCYDNKIVSQRIDDELTSRKRETPLFVEVYWDGKYDIVYKGLSNKIKLAKLFRDHAKPNARKCGYGLRNVFRKINSDSINIITHSTGTHVVSSLLFNVDDTYTLETPKNKSIIVALVASASSGKDLFQNYYKRNTDYLFASRDNYVVVNVFNKKDNVLRKAGLAKKYGNTSLGCNFQGESKKLRKYFVKYYPNSKYMEVPINEAPPANHFFTRYANSANFSKVIDILF